LHAQPLGQIRSAVLAILTALLAIAVKTWLPIFSVKPVTELSIALATVLISELAVAGTALIVVKTLIILEPVSVVAEAIVILAVRILIVLETILVILEPLAASARRIVVVLRIALRIAERVVVLHLIVLIFDVQGWTVSDLALGRLQIELVILLQVFVQTLIELIFNPRAQVRFGIRLHAGARSTAALV